MPWKAWVRKLISGPVRLGPNRLAFQAPGAEKMWRQPPTFNRVLSELARREDALKQRHGKGRGFRLFGNPAPARRSYFPESMQSSPSLYSNYLRYGESMGATSYPEFIRMAEEFYASASQRTNFGYTIVALPNNVIGVDYHGEIRGVYQRKDGEPLAFFRPSYREMGFNSRKEELEAWKRTGVTLSSVPVRIDTASA